MATATNVYGENPQQHPSLKTTCAFVRVRGSHWRSSMNSFEGENETVKAVPVDPQQSAVQTARWVAVSILLIAAVAFGALFLSRRGFREAQDERKALDREMQTLRDNYNSV